MTVFLSKTSTQARLGQANVEYFTAADFAAAGEDFEHAAGTLVFEDGETSKTVRVVLLDDQRYEGSESFMLKLHNAQGNAVIGQHQQSTFTIVDNEPATGTLQFSGTLYQVNEDDATVLATVIRQYGTEGEVSANFATENINALAGEHYTETFGTLTFEEGETTKTIEVSINNDDQYAGDKALSIRLSNPDNVVLGVTREAEISILEDDSPARENSSSNSGCAGFAAPVMLLNLILIIAFHQRINRSRKRLIRRPRE
jgi:Calx-beta domain